MRRCLCQLTPRNLELRGPPTRGVPLETSSEVGLPARSLLPQSLSERPPRDLGPDAGLADGLSSPIEMLALGSASAAPETNQSLQSDPLKQNAN